MLSILIPVFRQDVSSFVMELYNSAMKANIDFEILVADDGSGSDWEPYFKKLQSIEKVVVLRYYTNQGRSKIRNLLADQARYNMLLFLDGDGQLVNDQFINIYKEYLNKDIVSGGRMYPNNKTIRESQRLHYLYGLHYESKNANERNRNPANYFHSNNFLVTKKIMHQFPFNESLKSYGYEDSFWANELASNNLSILHIDNPVIHNGIEDSKKFLEKTNEALHNLYIINNEKIHINNKLVKTSQFIIQAKFYLLILPLYKLFEEKIYHNLLSKSPSILLFQIFKLVNYLKICLNK